MKPAVAPSHGAVEINPEHDRPLLLCISPSHRTEQSNAHGSCVLAAVGQTVDKQVAAVGPHTEAKAHRFPAVTEEKAACPQGLLQGLQNPPQVSFTSLSSWVCLLLAASYWEGARGRLVFFCSSEQALKCQMHLAIHQGVVLDSPVCPTASTSDLFFPVGKKTLCFDPPWFLL